MTYRFKLNETVSAGASRIGLEQIDIAEARLASRDDIPTAIHDARRCLKRLRALLRLIRPALAESTYRREANRIAGIGKLLADARDQHVMQQTLAKIETRFGTFPKSVGAKLTKLMANGSGTRSARAGAQERRQALDGLAQARKFFARMQRRPITFDHLAAGVERSYRRARRRFREAYESSDPTRPSTSGARPCSSTGATCSSSRGPGLTCWAPGPARPRNCRACSATITICASCSRLPTMRGKAVLSRGRACGVGDDGQVNPGRAEEAWPNLAGPGCLPSRPAT